LTTIYVTGLRIGDAVRLPVTAVDSKTMVLRVIGKGNKERILPINQPLLQLLRETWKLHRSNRYLFACFDGRAISKRSIERAVKQAREQLGFGNEFTPHVLRHSFATRLLEQGVPSETIQMLLGHASARSTRIYLHLTIPLQEDIRNKLDQSFADCLPKGGQK
jgi:site-specific recombinase XerD